jgi:uncharacterized membrane protein
MKSVKVGTSAIRSKQSFGNSYLTKQKLMVVLLIILPFVFLFVGNKFRDPKNSKNLVFLGNALVFISLFMLFIVLFSIFLIPRIVSIN